MKKLVFGLIALMVLLVAAILIVPSLVPASVYKETIQKQLTQELKRDVTITGDVSLSVFPSIRARTEQVTIANPDGFSDPYFAGMDSLEAHVKLWPLLQKRVEIKAFELIRPDINLEKRADGQANWVFGDATQETPIEDEGPFKRDGRYANIDPAIGKFSISDGAISYVDATTDRNYDIQNANLAFSLPSLSQPISIDGDLRLNGEPIDMGLRLDTPRAFLDGRDTPVSFDVKTEFADLKANGRFLESSDIAFEVDLDGEITEISKLSAFLPPMDYPIAQLASAITLQGTYLYDGKTLSAKGANIGVKGPLADFGFNGTALLTGSPVLDGQLDVDVRDLPALTKVLDQDINGIELTKTLKLNADLNAKDQGFAAKNITANITGDGLTGEFNGTGSFDKALSVEGAFAASANSIPRLVNALDIDMPQAAALGSADARGSVKMVGKSIEFTLDEAVTKGADLNATFSGSGSMKDAIALTGRFTADSPSIAGLVAKAQMDMPQAAALGSFDAAGTLNMQGERLTLDLEKGSTKDGALSASYIGQIDKIGDQVNLNGTFDTIIPSAKRVADVTGTAIPYSDVIGGLTAKGQIEGPADALTFSAIDAELTEGQLNGRYTGNATLKNGFALNGNLNADIPSVRNLAANGGTQLPPSTSAGRIYETVSVSGAVTGNPNEIKFTNADLAMDAISGKGDFTVDLTKGKPDILGTLDLGALDLRPYMAAYTEQRAGQGILPWSEAPMNFEVLKTIDGTFNIKVPEVLMTRLKMGETDITATIKNGVLTTRLPKISAYGGLGTMTTSLDVSGAVPAVAMDVKLDDVSSNAFLAAIANYTSLAGDGHTLLEVKGQGRSQAEIMRSLDGLGDFKVISGELAGIDLGQFMTGLDSAFTSRSLPSGIGPSFKTPFNDIVGAFKIKDGVVSIDGFELKALDAYASGSGKLDLGRQTVDFSFRPRLTGTNASDLASFGIPLRLSGSFNSVSAGLDSNLLGQIAAERAQAEVAKRLKEEVGGGLGDVVGGLLGGGQTPTEPVPSEPQTETPAESSTPSQTETTSPETTQPSEPAKPEEVVTDLLGGILGGNSKDPEPTSEPESAPQDPETADEEAAKEEKTEEPTVEDVLGSLFGKKKKDE